MKWPPLPKLASLEKMTPRCKIDLLRHGELEGEPVYCGVTDRPLSKQGWQQMVTACDIQNQWQVIISSPLIRCASFATHLSSQLSLPLRIDPRWQEMNFGQWDGLSAIDIMAFDETRLSQFWTNPMTTQPPDGESLTDVQTRVLHAWEELCAEKIPALVIAHGGPLRIVHCHLNPHPIERLLEIDVPYAQMRSITP